MMNIMKKNNSHIVSNEREEELTKSILETDLQDIDLSSIRESDLIFNEQSRVEMLLYKQLYERRKSETSVNLYASPKKIVRRETI